MSEIKLLPCPFCSGEAEYDQKTEFDHYGDMYTSHFVWCPYPTGGCGVRVYAKSKSEVTKLWNTRKPMDDIVKKLKKELNFADKEKERCSRENALMFDSAKSYSTGISNAIDIVCNARKDGAE